MARVFSCSFCLLLVFASRTASADIEWASDSLADGGTVKACIGETAELQWAFSLQPDDTVVKVEWFTIKDGVEQFLAISNGGHFLKSPATGLSLVFLPNAGLRVSNHTWQDFGQYRVTVHVARNGALLSSSRSAVLSPPDAPVLSTERLVARLLPHPKLDVATGEVQLQLSCGQFANVGSRAVSIVWRTPSGKIVPSTTMFKGSFLLTLSNPVQAGTYECLLEDPSVADKCVQNLSVLKRGAHVTVHQVPARLSLLDAQVDILRQKTEEADSDHKDSQTALASDVSDLRSELEKQTVADTAVQQQMADLTEKVNDVMTSVTSLTSRVDDLSTENKQLKEKLKQQEDEMESQRDLVRGQNERLENLTVSYSASDKLKSQVTELATNFHALDSNLADLQSKLEQHNQIVYFTAYVTIGQHIHASAGQVIRFPQTVENRGNAYDPDTGIFTAPSDGGYMFLVSVDISRGYEWLKIMRNGEDIVWGDHDGHDQHITAAVVISLTAGDKVFAVHCCSYGHIDQGKESVFVGFRVR